MCCKRCYIYFYIFIYSGCNSCATGKKVDYFDVFGQFLTFFGMSDVNGRAKNCQKMTKNVKGCPKTSM